MMRQFPEAVTALERAADLDPRDVQTQLQLGVALGTVGRPDEAIARLEEVTRLAPTLADAHTKLAIMLMVSGRRTDAITHHRLALERDANSLVSLRGLAWMLATDPDPALRNPAEAVSHAERAAELTRFGSPQIMDTLAAAYAASGRFDDAIRAAEHAVSVASQSGNAELASAIRARVELYRKGQPYVDE